MGAIDSYKKLQELINRMQLLFAEERLEDSKTAGKDFKAIYDKMGSNLQVKKAFQDLFKQYKKTDTDTTNAERRIWFKKMGSPEPVVQAESPLSNILA